MVVAEKLLLKPADYIDLLRPKQWVKNLFVLESLFFAGQFTEGRSSCPPCAGWSLLAWWPAACMC